MRPAAVLLSCLLAALVAAAAPQKPAEPAWWHPAWRFRRTVSLAGDRPGYVAVRFGTFGRTAADVADLAVVGNDKVRIPHTVLDAGREDTVLLWFAARDPSATYRIYFGNPSPKGGTAALPLEVLPASGLPRAGLICEIRKLGEGSADSWKDMRALIDASPTVLGRDLADACSLGVNPFGPSENYLALWYGHIQVAKAGTWKFATNSRGPSFVLIDDDVVASWPGWHDGDASGAAGEHAGEVKLKRGVHRFLYAFAARGNRSGQVCGVQGPADEELRPLGHRDWTPFLAATVGPLEELASKDTIDFRWRPITDLGLAGRDVSIVRFTDASAFPQRQVVDWEWHFGDGQSARGREVDHCFLGRGTFFVEVVLTLAGDTKLRNAARVAVNPRGAHGADVDRYVSATLDVDLGRLAPEALRNVVFLRWEDGRDDLRLFYQAAGALFRLEPALDDELETYAAALLEHVFLKDADGTDKLGGYLLRSARAPALRSSAALAAGATAWHLLGKKDAAAGIWGAAAAGGPRQRLFTALLSDLRRAEGKETEATELLDRALAMSPPPGAQELLRGDAVYRIKHHIETGAFGRAWSTLDDWIEAEPAALSAGEVSFLRAEILAAAGHPRPAIAEIERLLGAGAAPRRPVRRREILARAIELYRKVGDAEKAAATAKALPQEFPPETRGGRGSPCSPSGPTHREIPWWRAGAPACHEAHGRLISFIRAEPGSGSSQKCLATAPAPFRRRPRFAARSSFGSRPRPPQRGPPCAMSAPSYSPCVVLL